MRAWFKKLFCKAKKSEKGAVVVEATLSLTTFMFFIVTILSIVNISSAQANIGLALNATAKEISQYSYLYSLTGLDGVQAGNYAQTGDVRTSTDNVLSGLDGLMDALGSSKGIGQSVANGDTSISDGFDSIRNEIGNAQASGDKIYNELNNIASDPKKYIIGAARLGLNEITEVAKSKAIAGPLTKVFIQKHLVSYKGQSCDDYLNHLGIKGGLNGIDFSDSVIFLNGSDNIILVADYEVEVIKLLNHEIKLHFIQSAATKAWSATPIGSDLPKPPSGDAQPPSAPTVTPPAEDNEEENSGLSGEELEEQHKKEEENSLGIGAGSGDEEETKRPTWQESENYVGEVLYPGYNPQKPFLNGEATENDRKEAGSSVPDWYKDGHSVEVKNYTVVNEDGTIKSSGVSSLVSIIKKQYYERLKNLPEGTKQTVVIDLRGQDIPPGLKDEIIEKIKNATKNVSGYEEYNPKEIEIKFIE